MVNNTRASSNRLTDPNAKICPRCGKVVPLRLGICDHCARLFRTPFATPADQNRTVMFYHLPFPSPPPPARRPHRWAQITEWFGSLRLVRSLRGQSSHHV